MKIQTSLKLTKRGTTVESTMINPKIAWSERDRKTLLSMRAEGYSWEDIGKALRRSSSSCASIHRYASMLNTIDSLTEINIAVRSMTKEVMTQNRDLRLKVEVLEAILSA